MQKAIIELQGVSKHFGQGESRVSALEDISLSVYPGEIFGVIGLSGAGKSTLVRCINLLECPDEGRVLVNGSELTALKGRQLRLARKDIGMIFQGFHLLMQKTVLENVLFPLKLWKVPAKEARQKALQLLDKVGLSDKANAYPSQLSGGQKQRVAIARALATEPKILLCDEATSALDPTTTLSILGLLKEINRELGVTIVVITHQMEVVERICRRVAILDSSRLVELGEVEEIFRHPKTAEAKKLLFPQGDVPSKESLGRGSFLRLTFEGLNTHKPLVGEMMLHCGEPVNVVFADTRSINDCTYGQMLMQLPEKQETVDNILSFLSKQEGISFITLEGKEVG